MSKKASNQNLLPGMDHEEVEWHFEIDQPDTIENWLREHPLLCGFSVRPEAAKEHIDTYYDTEDWRFYRAGYALRVRRDAKNVEATMKSLSPAEDGLKRRRREISEPLRSGDAKALLKARGSVGERLRLLAGARELRPLFEIRNRRRIFTLRPGEEEEETAAEAGGSAREIVVDATGGIHRKETEGHFSEEEVVDTAGGIHRRSEEGLIAGEIALDAVEILAGEKVVHLGRIEVELKESELDAQVGEFVDEFRNSVGLRPAETSKFGAGLAATGLSPVMVTDTGPTKIDASMSAGEVSFAILRRDFAAMLEHEPGVRLDEDPEDLHDMRVATRRLRSTLKLYADALPGRSRRFERDLRWIAGALGEVRDLDVHLGRLAEQVAPEHRDGGSFEKTISALQERRVEARRCMLEALDSKRYERLVSGFSGMLRRGRSPEPTGPILEVAPALIRRRHKKVRKAARGLSKDSPPEAFHDLRKKGRRLRYAVEPLREIYGKPVKRMIRGLKSVQDDLGEQQDLVVAAGSLRELATSGGLPPEEVFSLGSMAGRYVREAEAIQSGFLDSKKLGTLRAGKSYKSLQKAMKKRAGE